MNDSTRAAELVNGLRQLSLKANFPTTIDLLDKAADFIERITPKDGELREALEIADYLTDQRDEPWPGPDGPRIHYWRDKAIHAANKLRALSPIVGEGER